MNDTMTAEESLLELAERCEASAGPSRSLDFDIAVDVLGYKRIEDRFMWSPQFTASIDAAMLLVPDRARWMLRGIASGSLPFFYEAFVNLSDVTHTGSKIVGQATTPALALIAACLRARLVPASQQR